MVKCSSCGFDNPDDGKFCTNCGKPVEAPKAPGGAAGPFCTNCGEKIPPDSRFCVKCGVAVGTAGLGESPQGVGVAGVAALTIQAFLATLDERLGQNGFEKVEPPAVLNLDRWMRRKRFELAKVSMITTICGVKTLTEKATSAYVQNFSKSVFDFACSNKGFLARNTFQQLLVYPVLIAPAYDAGVETFLNSYWHKHWMAYEYPVVVSLSTRQVAMHRSTPVWGAAFHGSFKREAESLFAT